MATTNDAPLEEDWSALTKQANDAFLQGRFADVIPLLDRMLLIAGDTTEREGCVHSFFSAVYGSMGQFDKALWHSQQHHANADERGDAKNRAAALGNMGQAFRNMGHPAKQVDCIHEAMALCRAENDHDGECVHHANLGVALKALGQRDAAFEAHLQELALAERHNLTNRIIGAHGRVGSAYKDALALDKATEHFERQMQLAKAAGDGLNERKALVSLA
ncbi:hypothetical protein T484DRAFT_1757710, partial [Baffinella frigidus]